MTWLLLSASLSPHTFRGPLHSKETLEDCDGLDLLDQDRNEKKKESPRSGNRNGKKDGLLRSKMRLQYSILIPAQPSARFSCKAYLTLSAE